MLSKVKAATYRRANGAGVFHAAATFQGIELPAAPHLTCMDTAKQGTLVLETPRF